MSQPAITVYGAYWCPDCRRAKKFLGKDFVFIGQQPNSAFAKGYVEMDRYGFVLAGHDLVHGREVMGREPFAFETSAPGVFAAGDVRHGSTKQVASAVGEGAAAAISIREFLKTR